MLTNETVAALAARLDLTPVYLPAPDRVITGGYTGDLLSWVMGRAPADSVWVTVMSNVNVVAVASLSDVACVILAEGAQLDPTAAQRAETQGINVLRSDKTAFELCRLI